MNRAPCGESMHRMRAAIRPAFLPGISGGIEPYVQGLALGLGALEGEDRFDFVGTPAQRSSLAPFISGPAQWVELPTLPMTSSPGIRRLVHRAHLAGLARRVRGSALRLTQRRGQETVNRRLPRAPDTVELGPYDVVHFAAQAGEVTKLPTIYQPWDVQHLHYPEFFSRDALEQRAAVWEPCSQRARYVLVASDFVRRDVIDAFGIEPERVAVVHPGSPLSTAVARVESTRPFALFPAQTWKHKNHARLIDALAILRSRGTDVTVVCPGQPNVRDPRSQTPCSRSGGHRPRPVPGFCVPRGARRAVFNRAVPAVPFALRRLRLPRPRGVCRGPSRCVLEHDVATRGGGRRRGACSTQPTSRRSRTRSSECGLMTPCGRRSPNAASYERSSTPGTTWLDPAGRSTAPPRR